MLKCDASPICGSKSQSAIHLDKNILLFKNASVHFTALLKFLKFLAFGCVINFYRSRLNTLLNYFIAGEILEMLQKNFLPKNQFRKEKRYNKPDKIKKAA